MLLRTRVLAAAGLCSLASATWPGAGSAQEEPQVQTLIGGGIDKGGFGGPVFKFTEVDERFGFMLGFRGGWIIDHTFVLGAGLYGLANPHPVDTVLVDPRRRLHMGYGGLELEWIVGSHRIVHLTLQSLLGAGAVGYDDHGSCCTDETVDAFFIAEPAANVVLNVHQVFRVALGGGYRFVADVDLDEITHRDLSGPTGTVTLKFGVF